MQKKKHSLIESVTNMTVALVSSFLIQIIMYPILGLEVNLSQTLSMTGVFFVIGTLRGYILRRFFMRVFKEKECN